MRGLYGRHYSSRYKSIAELITPGSSVLDLCCGPGILYRRYLRDKAVSYTGFDVNPNFIKSVVSSGACGEVRDLRKDESLPSADYVIMQASLYHFLPDPLPILNRMEVAARRALIIAEPIRNVSSSTLPFVRWLTRVLTDPGLGAQPHRFTEQSLDELFADSYLGDASAFLISGGREKIYVIHKNC